MNAMTRRRGKRHGIRECTFDRYFTIAVYGLLAIILLLVIYPLYFVLLASVSDPQYVNSGTPLWYPRGFTLLGYRRVFADTRIWMGYANTLLYTGCGTVLSVVVTMMSGYALSRKDLPGRNLLMAYFVFTMYFGGGL
ncbi:MAG: carbohydrate ABC transporter permease, partial [Clostridia bacterium]